MDTQQYMDSLANNIRDFEAAASLGLEPKVPSCPDWTVGQLVVHLSGVFAFWAKIVADQVSDQAGAMAVDQVLRAERETFEKPEFYLSSDALPHFSETAQRLQTSLENADSTRLNWTWYPPEQNAGFVQRRQAHESLVHRWDAQSAHGVQTPLAPAELAADGVDEILRNALVGWSDMPEMPTGTYHLHCTDTDGEWMIASTDEGVDVTREHGKADIALAGTASDLNLFLWGRIGSETLTVHGDAARISEVRALVKEAV